jgi:hypothetical protein
MAGRVLAWRLPAIDTWPAVVAFVQTWAGKLLLFALCAGLMKLHAGFMAMSQSWLWLAVTVAAAVVSLAARYRHLALIACAAALLVLAPDWIEFAGVWAVLRQENVDIRYVRLGTLIACMPLALTALYLARRYRDHPLGSRPVLVQHVLYVCLVGLAASHLLRGIPQVLAWSAIAIFSAYFAFLAYALIDQRRRRPAPVLWQLATFNPFAWPTTIPMGKDAATWRSMEAGTAAELAATQLKGLKLLAWAAVLKLALWAYRWIVYQKLGVPPLRIAFEAFVLSGDVSGAFGMLSVIANFPEQLLQVAIWGHVIIGVARLAGFRLLRNTCRPLASRTIAEFWNRYVYYFKEVLVQVYFYPTFVRCFKRHPRLRLAFATFMAAGAGNYFLHLILVSPHIAGQGVVQTLIRSQTYAFYCIVLVAGLVVSQLRARAPAAGAGWLRGRFLPALGVAAFFCFLSFFDGPQRHASLGQHFGFLFQVFRVDRWFL